MYLYSNYAEGLGTECEVERNCGWGDKNQIELHEDDLLLIERILG